MATQKKRKRNGKINFSQSACITKKNDSTIVARQDMFPTIQGRPPASVAPVFKVKIRKK